MTASHASASARPHARRSARGHRLDWRPDLPDIRDHLFASHHAVNAATVPDRVDLRPKCPPIVDQGSLGSCTANALAGALGFIHGGPSAAPASRLFVYYGERVLEGTIRQDAGAEIRDGVRVLNKLGAPPEADWPYVMTKFARKPPKKAFADALKQRISTYQRITTHDERLQCLADGAVIVFGFTCYESLDSDEVARTGVLPMPAPGEKVTGGHAVVLVGYDRVAGTYLVRNSWGTSWGLAGYFTMPFAYVDDDNLSDDYWTLRA